MTPWPSTQGHPWKLGKTLRQVSTWAVAPAAVLLVSNLGFAHVRKTTTELRCELLGTQGGLAILERFWTRNPGFFTHQFFGRLGGWISTIIFY